MLYQPYHTIYTDNDIPIKPYSTVPPAPCQHIVLLLITLCQLQVLERGANLGSGILELGYESCPETFVGIYASNKTEVRQKSLFICFSLLSCLMNQLVINSVEVSPIFGHANANFSVFTDRIRNQFLKK